MSFVKDKDNIRAGTNRNKSMSIDWEKMFGSEGYTPRGRRSSPKFINAELKTAKHFCTGSSYTGQWNNLGMSGIGNYDLFYDVKYSGTIKDGMFHNEGCLMYPNGAKMDGIWNNGHMECHRYVFSDNMIYGPYCEMPDRRFFNETQHGLRPAGKSYLTNDLPARIIPKGCYDTGDGFYNPKTKCVIDAEDPKKIVRIPTKYEEQWIIKNCRKAWDEPAGYRRDLFENWQEENLKNKVRVSDKH